MFRICSIAVGAVISFSTAAEDAPSVYNAAKADQTFSFAFHAATNTEYDVERSESLHGGNWTKLRSVLPGSSRSVTIEDAAAVSSSGFYRVVAAEGRIVSNPVGYINLNCTVGTNLIANQLFNAPNRLGQLISTAPENTLVWKIGPLGPECAEFRDGSWHDCLTGWESEIVLYPGQGALLITPEDFTATFVGRVMEGALTNQLPSGLSLCSSILPQEGAVSSVLAFVPHPGDMLYQFDRAAQSYRSYVLLNSGWSPAEPVISVGESFWVELGEASTWVRQFFEFPCHCYYWVKNYPHHGDIPPAPGRQGPFIVSEPRGQTVEPGSAVTLSVGASGSPRLSFHWRFGQSDIASGTNAVLTLANPQRSDRGNYSVTVSNAFGCITSAVARLIVEPRPALRAQLVAGGVMNLCWPGLETVYVLQESESLLGGWSNVSTAPTRDENGSHCVTVPGLGSRRFYRLRATGE